MLIQLYGRLDLAKFYIKVENKDPIYKKTDMGLSINHVDMEGTEGVNQISILIHKFYLEKWSTRREGAKKFQKLSTWFMDNSYSDTCYL